MKEQLISLETAMLAKRKRFNEPCKTKYIITKTKVKLKTNKTYSSKINKKFMYISVPTQSLLQKWLREVHLLHIDIRNNTVSNPKWFLSIHKVNGYSLINSDTYYNSYEEALEKGLLEAFKLIINK